MFPLGNTPGGIVTTDSACSLAKIPPPGIKRKAGAIPDLGFSYRPSERSYLQRLRAASKDPGSHHELP